MVGAQQGLPFAPAAGGDELRAEGREEVEQEVETRWCPKRGLDPRGV